MAAGAPARAGGNVFTRKLGPLPAWVWMAIAAAVVLLIVVYEYHKNSSSSGSSTASADVTPPVVEQFQLTTPPEQPTPTPTPTPTPGPKKHKPKTRRITVGGPHATKDLDQLAKQYGITEAELIKLNPHLKQYEGSKKPIPVKTKITV